MLGTTIEGARFVAVTRGKGKTAIRFALSEVTIWRVLMQPREVLERLRRTNDPT